MTLTTIPDKVLANPEQVRDEWLSQLGGLVSQVEGWAQDAGWATRRLEKRMQDSRLGAYIAPMLLLQEGAARLLLEPIARFAPGADGVVDLYLMPAYDDIASLYLTDGNWQLHFLFPEPATEGNNREAKPVALTSESFQKTLEAMSRNAA